MEILKELYRNTRRDHWREGFVWLAWSLVGGLFPVWLTVLVLYLTRQKIALEIFTDNGEFALYSASYVGGSLYLLFNDFRDLKQRRFPSRAILGLVFVVLLMASAAAFMVVAMIGVFGTAGKPEMLKLLDREALRCVSLWLFGASMVFSLLLVVVDNMRTMPDLSEMADKRLDKLNRDFDGLEGGNQ